MFSKFRVWDELKQEYIAENLYIGSNGDLYKLEYGEMLDITCPYLIVENMVGFKRDKNGQYVFEGDLIRFKDDNRIAEVYYSEELGAWFCKFEDRYVCPLLNAKEEFTIIGNKHKGEK